MSFRVGQKVVAINSASSPNQPRVRGEIYPVLAIVYCQCGEANINIGTEPDHRHYSKCSMCGAISIEDKLVTSVRHFRPIVDIGDEVEEYIKQQIKEPEYA